jgi:hypothetical protein
MRQELMVRDGDYSKFKVNEGKEATNIKRFSSPVKYTSNYDDPTT